MTFGPSPLTIQRGKRRARSLVALLLLAGMAWAAWIWRPVPPVRLPLVHVIDGDSLKLQRDGETLLIRLTGVHADRKSVVSGKRETVRVSAVGGRNSNKKTI